MIIVWKSWNTYSHNNENDEKSDDGIDVPHAEEVKSFTPVRFTNFQVYPRTCINRDILRKLRMEDVLLIYFEQIVSILYNFVLNYKFTPVVLWKLDHFHYILYNILHKCICDFCNCYDQYLGCNKSIIQSLSEFDSIHPNCIIEIILWRRHIFSFFGLTY